MGDETPAEVRAALDEWQRATDTIAVAFESVDPSRLDAPSACGDWTNRELMAHIATGYAVRVGWLSEALEGTPASRTSGDEANARMVAALRGASKADLVAELRRQRDGVAALLRRLASDMLDRPVRRSDGRVTPLRDAVAEFSAHDLAHLEELRARPSA